MSLLSVPTKQKRQTIIFFQPNDGGELGNLGARGSWCTVSPSEPQRCGSRVRSVREGRWERRYGSSFIERTGMDRYADAPSCFQRESPEYRRQKSPTQDGGAHILPGSNAEPPYTPPTRFVWKQTRRRSDLASPCPRLCIRFVFESYFYQHRKIHLLFFSFIATPCTSTAPYRPTRKCFPAKLSIFPTST